MCFSFCFFSNNGYNYHIQILKIASLKMYVNVYVNMQIFPLHKWNYWTQDAPAILSVCVRRMLDQDWFPN